MNNCSFVSHLQVTPLEALLFKYCVQRSVGKDPFKYGLNRNRKRARRHGSRALKVSLLTKGVLSRPFLLLCLRQLIKINSHWQESADA